MDLITVSIFKCQPHGRLSLSFKSFLNISKVHKTLLKVIHIAHALVADEGGKPGLEEVQKEEEEEEHIGTAGFDVAVHRSD